jgi:hypothetical protein
MAPATWLAARRRTVLFFYDNGTTVERLAVSRYGVGSFFEGAWDPEKQPSQWKRVAQLIQEKNPKKIAINNSTTFALADGLSQTEGNAFRDALTPEFQKRLVSGERLAIGWLERRIPEEMEVYPTLCRIAHEIILEGLSNQAVQPGHTTTEDLQWWFRDRITQLRLDTWFHPSVSIQRQDGGSRGSFATQPETQVIRRGDLLHLDFGITYLGLNTDTQQHAYVLKTGETEAPEGLTSALRDGNRVQDLLLTSFRTGRTGNEMLKEALEKCRQAGLDATIYTHPLGFHGHAAGPTIGMWDQQDGVPGAGDYPLFADTAYSIELNNKSSIPEWDGQEIRIMLEEDAFFSGETIQFIDGRQTELILIR